MFVTMKKYWKYLAPLGLDLLLTIVYLMMVGGDQSISIIILFFFLLVAVISLVVGIVLLCKKRWICGALWMVNALIGGYVISGASMLFYRLGHVSKYRNYVCYDVQATRWHTFSNNFELELSRHSPACTICSFDERYPGGGYTGSSDWRDGTYSVNPDGSYQIVFDTDTLLLRNDTLYGLADYGVLMERM